MTDKTLEKKNKILNECLSDSEKRAEFAKAESNRMWEIQKDQATALKKAEDRIKELEAEIRSIGTEVEAAVYDAFHNMSQPSMVEHVRTYGAMKDYTLKLVKQALKL